jgi:hypothetical protein
VTPCGGILFVPENEEDKNRGIQRYSIASRRTSSLGVITFGQLMRTEHVVRIVNLSVVGVGIESSERIEPGLVCFKEQVGGHKFGVLTWSRQSGDQYRAGINFLTLPHEQEVYLRKQAELSRPGRTLGDPERVSAALLESIKGKMDR